MRKHIHIVTDGSAIGNPGPGGWAAVLSCGRNRWRISGAAENTTANEMELTAAIEALKSIEIGSRVTLCSDSEYLIRGMRHLADRWLLQGWRKNLSILQPGESLPANHWIVVFISGIFDPGDDAAHAQELDEMAGIRRNINSMAYLSSTGLHQWNTCGRNNRRSDRSGNSGSAGVCYLGRDSYDGHSRPLCAAVYSGSQAIRTVLSKPSLDSP